MANRLDWTRTSVFAVVLGIPAVVVGYGRPYSPGLIGQMWPFLLFLPPLAALVLTVLQAYRNPDSSASLLLWVGIAVGFDLGLWWETRRTLGFPHPGHIPDPVPGTYISPFVFLVGFGFTVLRISRWFAGRTESS